MKKNVCLSRLLLSVLPVLAALVMASCTRHSEAWPQLLEAETLLETDLPTAGAMIDSIDASLLHGEDAALYAILKTQADYKRYLPLTSDSLPRLAADFYGTPYRKNYHTAMAWYSLGCYYTEQKDDAKAIESYLRAKDLYPDTLVRYYALCEQNLGKHFLYHRMFPEALQSLLLFKRHPICVAEARLLVSADYLIGLTYLEQSDFTTADTYFHDVLGNPACSSYYYSLANFQLAKILYYSEHDLANTLSYLNAYLFEQPFSNDGGPALALKGDICKELGMLDSARYYYRNSLVHTDDMYTLCHACQQLANVYLYNHQEDSVSFFFARYDSLREVIHTNTNTKDILSVAATHQSEKEHHEKIIKQHYLMSFVCLIAVLILILQPFKTRKKKVQAVQFLMDISRSRQSEQIALSFIADADDLGEDTSGEDASSHELQVSKPSIAVIDEATAIIKQERSKRASLYREQFRESPYFHLLISMNSPKKSKESGPTIDKNDVIQDLLHRGSELAWDLCQSNNHLSASDILFCICNILSLPEEAMLYLLGGGSHRSLITRKSRIKKDTDPMWFQLIFG